MTATSDSRLLCHIPRLCGLSALTEHLMAYQMVRDQVMRQPIGTLHKHHAHVVASNTCVQVGEPFAVVDVVFRRWCLTPIGVQP